MPRVDQKMPAPPSVGTGATTTFRLPIGRRYHSLQLLASATTITVADLTEIRVLLNNKIIQRFSGADRNVMNRFDGRDDAANTGADFSLELPFDRYGILTKAGEEETAINTGSLDPTTGKVINSFSIEVDLAGPGGITGTPALSMNATTSEALPGGPGSVPHILKSTRDFSAAQQYEISDLPRGGVTTQFLDKIFMKPSTSTLDLFKVLANQTTLFERTAALNERKQRDGIRFPQAGWYCIDRSEHGYGGDPFDLRGLEDWRLQLTTGAALTATLYSHYIGGLGD
ncbi:MAG TPA: major capsid protein P2 [Gammaproteobacteria bacterium]|nr:major capsid protein P2 [Gammaproteobacteria bacterium]